MANQSINQSEHMDGLQKFIEKDSHEFPDWINHSRESSLKKYKEVCPKHLKNATWKNTKLNEMLNDFFEKEFSVQQSTHENIDLKSNLDNSLTIYFHAGVFFTEEEIPSYIKLLNHKYLEENQSIFGLEDRSERQSIPYLLNNIVSRDALMIDTAVNQNVERLIHIVYLPNQNGNVAPRLNINVSENSSIKIIEEHLQSNNSIINHCIDINCEATSSLEYYKVNHRQNDSYLISNLNLNQEEDTDVKIFNLDLGADSGSSLNHLKLNGENSNVACSTLFMPSDHRSSHLSLIHI